MPNSGRVSKTEFIGTSSALLGLCLLSSFIRFYIRFYIQREFGWDDAFLIFGMCCLVAGTVVTFTIVSYMYEAELFVVPGGRSISPDRLPDLMAKHIPFSRRSAAAVTLLWGSIFCVKLSFMALFKKLIRPIPAITIYWWFTLVFNIAVFVYSILSYFLPCPYYSGAVAAKTVKCVQPAGRGRIMSHATAQMIIDIIGDLFILVIPVILIWQIRVRWTQKIGLSFTLCLTVIIIVITITRIAGLKWKGRFDPIWYFFFLVITAEIGLLLGAITAVRALYVSKAKNRQVQETITTFNWYHNGRSALRNIFSTVARRGNGGGERTGNPNPILQHEIPNATMTGVRTFMEGHEQSTASESTNDRGSIKESV